MLQVHESNQEQDPCHQLCLAQTASHLSQSFQKVQNPSHHFLVLVAHPDAHTPEQSSSLDPVPVCPEQQVAVAALPHLVESTHKPHISLQVTGKPNN